MTGDAPQTFVRSVLLTLSLFITSVSYSQISELEVEVNWPSWSSDNKVEVYDPLGNLILEICDPVNCQNTLINSNFDTVANIGCFQDASGYYLIALDAYGDGWNGFGSFVEVRAGGNPLLNYNLTSGSSSGNQFFTVSGGGTCNTIDGSLENILEPTSKCGLSASETVTVVLRNQGINSVSSWPVEYRINGGSYQSAGTLTTTVAPGATANFSFTLDLSSQGAYTLDVRSALPGDLNSANNEILGYEIYNAFPHDFVNQGDFTMGFEAGEETGGWSIVDDNSDGLTWTFTDSDFPRTGVNSASYTYSPTIDADDWLITACLDLEAGVTYELDYYYRVRSGIYPEDFDVVLLDAQDPSAVVTTIESLVNQTNTSYQLSNNSFSVGQTGTYYMAWHAVSDADEWVLYVDDITIRRIASVDARISSIVEPPSQCELTSSEPFTAFVFNAGTSAISNIPVEFSVDGGPFQPAGTVNSTLSPGDSAAVNFNADLSGAGDHLVTVRTQLAGDEIPGNDALVSDTVSNLSVDFLETVYTMGFEVGEDLSGWATLDANNDGVQWQLSTQFPNTGSRCGRYTFNNSQQANDWVFSTCLFFEAGETYEVEFFYRARNSNRDETMSLVVTSDQTAGSVVSTIANYVDFSNTSYVQSLNTFTVPSSGTYYIAWHATSASNQRGIYIDDISIRNVKTTWLGNTTDWTDNNNWSNTAPLATTATFIPQNPIGGNAPNITSTVTCGDLEIETGAVINFSASGVLEINGDVNGALSASDGQIAFTGSALQTIQGECQFHDLTIDNAAGVDMNADQSIIGVLDLIDGVFTTNGNELLLVSDQNGTARVAPVTNGSIAGDITAQRYIDAGATNWRFLAAPVSGIDFEAWDDDFITSGFIGSDYPNFNFTSIYLYDETLPGNGDVGYIPLTNSNQSINPGEGYWVYCGDQSSGTNPFTIDVTGPMNTGDIELNVSYTSLTGPSHDGWTMAGNPYPSPIDWDSPGWNRVNMNDAVYIYDPDLDQYATYINGVGTNGGTRYIASGQAIFIQANGPNPLLEITESAKATTEPVFFDEQVDQMKLIRLKVQNENSQDETVIRFGDGASNAFEGNLDAFKINSSMPGVPNMASITNGEKFSVNTLPELTTQLTIPISVIVNQSGEHSISLIDLKNFGTSACIVLEDKFLNEFHNIKVSPYTCNISDTTSVARFALHVSPELEKDKEDATCYQFADGELFTSVPFTSPSYEFIWRDDNGNVISQQTKTLPADTVSNVTAGRYFIEVVTQGNCPVIRDSLSVQQPPQVIAGFTLNAQLLDLSKNELLEIDNLSTGATQYQWSFGDGSNSLIESPSHLYQLPGTYQVSLSAQNDNECEDHESALVTVVDSSIFLSADQQVSADGYRLYGNGSIYYLEFEKALTDVLNIEMYDVSGKLVYQSRINPNSGLHVRLDVSAFSSGIYILKLRSEGDALDGSESIYVQ